MKALIAALRLQGSGFRVSDFGVKRLKKTGEGSERAREREIARERKSERERARERARGRVGGRGGVQQLKRLMAIPESGFRVESSSLGFGIQGSGFRV